MSIKIHAPPTRTGGAAFIKAVSAVSTVCGWIAAGFTVIALFVTCQMIFVRFVLGQSTIWQTEAVIYLMIGATTIGLPYVQLLRGHINVDLVPMALPPRARLVLAWIVLLSTIVVVGLVAFYSVHVWLEAFERNWKSSTVWGPRLWIPYLVMPVGFGLFLLQLLADLVGLATGLKSPFHRGDA